jgi:hypothetical protein
MPKYRVEGLEGARLDAAVAKAQGQAYRLESCRVHSGGYGITIVRDGPVCVAEGAVFEPSSDWATGGPIIEREGISAFSYVFEGAIYWYANKRPGEPFGKHGTASLLVAAMRAYVASKLGEEVELP